MYGDSLVVLAQQRENLARYWVWEVGSSVDETSEIGSLGIGFWSVDFEDGISEIHCWMFFWVSEFVEERHRHFRVRRSRFLPWS